MKKFLQIIPVLFLSLASHFAMSQCQAPTNLSASYSNNVSTFSWDLVPGINTYQFELKFQWDPWGSGAGFTVTGNTFSLTGLFQSAPFEWRVSTDCGNSTYGTSASMLYSTPCPEPGNPVVSNITGTTATLSWTPAPGYNTITSNFSVSYRLANTSNAWTWAGSTSTPTKNLAGLTSNTMYEYRIYQSCMYSNSTPITGTFTTAFVACNIPTTISITNASYNQATVSWAAVSGFLNYTVEYKPVTGSVWSSVTASSNTKVLTGLTSATLYDVRVKANCSAGSSGYITSQFTTYHATCPAWGANGSEYIDLVALGSINRTSSREVGGYYNTGLSTTLSKGSTNAGQFSAGYNPGIIFNENFAVYIDFNRNGNFGDAGERVVNPTLVTSGAAIYNFNVTIPNNVSTGSTKMRVIVCRTGTTITPCQFTNFKGEVEDYNVTIVNHNRSGNVEEDTPPSDQLLMPALSVYPNPSDAIFTIQMPVNTRAVYYEILGSNGAVVEKKNIEAVTAFRVDMSKYTKGMYILNIISPERKTRLTQKLNLVK
ncbi:MAG: T9SS type A sorting domain-containing protein [Chitinophagaceae bacterium]|nr:T9SS type A sorting domain-containing protein [Chitinophagaceae bacterium]